MKLTAMDDTATGSIFSKIVVTIFILALFDLMFINWWVIKKSDQSSTAINQLVPTSTTASDTQALPQPSPVASGVDNDRGSLHTPTPSPTPVTKQQQTEVVVQTPYKEIFVPIGSGSTNSTTFADLNGVEVGVDTSKYGTIDYVVFEASIWVDGGNGMAKAQLKNVTDNNPFIESQVSNITSTPTLRTSGKIPFPSGSKTYRVQAKTELEQYAAHVENARLKIVLK